MALTSTELEAMRDALVRSRASGTKSVTFDDGRKVEYISDSEMRAAIADLELRMRRLGTSVPNAVRFKTSKGF